jgi:cell division protein FtsW (lipid II flippase)
MAKKSQKHWLRRNGIFLLPALGLVPVIFGSVLLSDASHYLDAYDDSVYFYSGLDKFIYALFWITVGALFALVAAIIIAIKYRKKIVWATWILTMIFVVVIGVAAVAAGEHYDDKYYNATKGIGVMIDKNLALLT